MEDFLPSPTAAHRLGDGLGSPRHLLIPRPPPGHPKEGPALQLPLCHGPSAPQGPGEGDRREAGSAFGVAGD